MPMTTRSRLISTSDWVVSEAISIGTSPLWLALQLTIGLDQKWPWGLVALFQ